jgi:hypothetical protein
LDSLLERAHHVSIIQLKVLENLLYTKALVKNTGGVLWKGRGREGYRGVRG